MQLPLTRLVFKGFVGELIDQSVVKRPLRMINANLRFHHKSYMTLHTAYCPTAAKALQLTSESLQLLGRNLKLLEAH